MFRQCWSDTILDNQCASPAASLRAGFLSVCSVSQVLCWILCRQQPVANQQRATFIVKVTSYIVQALCVMSGQQRSGLVAAWQVEMGLLAGILVVGVEAVFMRGSTYP